MKHSVHNKQQLCGCCVEVNPKLNVDRVLNLGLNFLVLFKLGKCFQLISILNIITSKIFYTWFAISISMHEHVA